MIELIECIGTKNTSCDVDAFVMFLWKMIKTIGGGDVRRKRAYSAQSRGRVMIKEKEVV